MKKSILFLALFILVVSSCYTQTADEIIQKSMDAKGGKDNLFLIKSIITEGTMSMMGMEMKFVNYAVNPDKSYVKLDMEGMEFIEATDGVTAWTINPMLGSTNPKKVSNEETEEYKQRGKTVEEIYDYSNNGGSLELLENEQINGSENYKIKFTSKDGESMIYYFDTSNFLLTRIDKNVKIKGKDMESTTVFSDYKLVGNVNMPHKMEVDIKNTPMGKQTITVTKIRINPEIDNKIFSMPSK